MKELTIKELYDLQLELLQYIDQLCRRNQIEYSLGGGSLIGAIRHKGYIPWDDDIDIMLKRSEYERLIIQLGREKGSKFSLIHFSKGNAFLPFAKIYNNQTIFKSEIDSLHLGTGVFLDIFPIDAMPNELAEIQKFRRQNFINILKLASAKKGGTAYASASQKRYYYGKLIALAPWHFYYQNHYIEIFHKVDSFMQRYNHLPVKHKGYVCSGYKAEYFPREIFEEYEDVPFEHLNVRKIKEHEVYLSQLYGDYMQLPPENKRVNHSYYRWYWKNK